MNKKNKMFLRLFVTSITSTIMGAYFKVNGNENGDILLLVGLLFYFSSLIGLFFNNLSKIKTFLK